MNIDTQRIATTSEGVDQTRSTRDLMSGPSVHAREQESGSSGSARAAAVPPLKLYTDFEALVAAQNGKGCKFFRAQSTLRNELGQGLKAAKHSSAT